MSYREEFKQKMEQFDRMRESEEAQAIDNSPTELKQLVIVNMEILKALVDIKLLLRKGADDGK